MKSTPPEAPGDWFSRSLAVLAVTGIALLVLHAVVLEINAMAKPPEICPDCRTGLPRTGCRIEPTNRTCPSCKRAWTTDRPCRPWRLLLFLRERIR